MPAIEPLTAAATPALRLRVAIDAGRRAVEAVGLNVQVRICAQRRRHDAHESGRLWELFGAPEDFERSLAALPWAQLAHQVGPFTGATEVALTLPCTYDLEVTAAKYLTVLGDGEVPLELLFSGTVQWRAPDGRLQSALIPWDREAQARLPVSAWRAAMAACFGESAWLRVHGDVFARLQAFRAARGLSSWEQTIEMLLGERG